MSAHAPLHPAKYRVARTAMNDVALLDQWGTAYAYDWEPGGIEGFVSRQEQKAAAMRAALERYREENPE